MIPVNGRFAVDREFVYIAFPFLKHFVGASWCKLAIWVSLGPSWVSLVRSWRQDVLQEASKLRSRGDPNRIWGHLGAKRAPNAATLKNCDYFPRKCANNLVNNSKSEPPVILHRIQRICQKWGVGLQVRTSLPHAPGAKMTVVTHTPSNH